MIAWLKGVLLEKSPSRVIVDVAGVGYNVQVPLSTFYGLGDSGSSVTLRIHTHVREEVIALYGFASALEQELFERLIAISGVGPKLALAVLSGIEPAELVRAVRSHDVARLTRIPGIGKKTAERIALELKDRLSAAMQTAGQTEPAASGDHLRDDIVSALLNLGYQRAAAERAVEKVMKTTPAPDFERALKDTLRGLLKG